MVCGPDERLFTAPGAWGGENFELFILARESDDQLAETLRAVWSDPLLDGPYQRRDTEPHEQPRLALLTLPLCDSLFGSIEMPDGVRAGVYTYTIATDEEDTTPQPTWLGVALPTGSLARAYGTDERALEAETELEWQDPVTGRLRQLAEAIYTRVRFRGAVIGWDPSRDEIEQALAEGVPPTRRVGYLLPDGEALRWHPPSPRAPVAVHPRVGPIQTFVDSDLGFGTILSALLIVFVAGAVTTTAPMLGVLVAAVLGAIPAILFAWAYLALGIAAWAGWYVAPVRVRAVFFTIGVGVVLAAASPVVRFGASIGLLPDTGWYGLAAYLAGHGVATVALVVLALRVYREFD